MGLAKQAGRALPQRNRNAPAHDIEMIADRAGPVAMQRHGERIEHAPAIVLPVSWALMSVGGGRISSAVTG